MKMKPKYTIEQVKKGYVIVRPDGSHNNSKPFDTMREAEAKLEMLVVYGLCRR